MTRPRSIRARYVFPVEGPPIEGGIVTVVDGRIASVRSGKAPADLDLGNAAIVPGFVNTHTHLELSPIPGPDSGTGAEDEIEWLARVIAQRRLGSLDSLREASRRHVADAIASGTTMVADTTTAGLSWPDLAEAPIRAVVFCELIGLKRERGLETIKSAFEWLATLRPETQSAACARPGLSPTPRTARPVGSISGPPIRACRCRPTWRKCPRKSSF